MILGTLDGYYPSFIDILALFGILISAIFLQIAISSVLIEKYQAQRVYGGYYFTTSLISFIMGQVVFGEVLGDFGTGLMVFILAEVAALFLVMEDVKENKLTQEVCYGEQKGK